MKDFKGTKGKWISRYNNSYWEVNREEDFEDGKRLSISVMVFNVKDGECISDRTYEAKANAQLISAAPMLLFELQELVRICKANNISADSAEYAIAKALGKEADND